MHEFLTQAKLILARLQEQASIVSEENKRYRKALIMCQARTREKEIRDICEEALDNFERGDT